MLVHSKICRIVVGAAVVVVGVVEVVVVVGSGSFGFSCLPFPFWIGIVIEISLGRHTNNYYFLTRMHELLL